MLSSIFGSYWYWWVIIVFPVIFLVLFFIFSYIGEKNAVKRRQARNWQNRDYCLEKYKITVSENYFIEAFSGKYKIIVQEVIVDRIKNRVFIIDYASKRLKLTSISKSSIIGFLPDKLAILLDDRMQHINFFNVSSVMRGGYKGYNIQYISGVLCSIFGKIIMENTNAKRK